MLARKICGTDPTSVQNINLKMEGEKKKKGNQFMIRRG
jgi:hypothetical protein